MSGSFIKKINRIKGKKVDWTAWLYLAPALFLLTIFLVYPTIDTFITSLYKATAIRTVSFVGFKNYADVLSDRATHVALKNNLIWIIVNTPLTVSLGLVFAVMADSVKHESVVKSIFFIPMAISMVAAGVIWTFIYNPSISRGTLNALLNLIIPNYKPIPWLAVPTLNTFCMIAANIWMGVGLAVIIISAALKGIPNEIIEAAKIDGATQTVIFWRITIPMIAPTLAVITTTSIISVLKVFDIVYVMTDGGPYLSSEVIANRMIRSMFRENRFGYASAIAIVLVILIIPVMVMNIKRFKQQEETR